MERGGELDIAGTARVAASKEFKSFAPGSRRI